MMEKIKIAFAAFAVTSLLIAASFYAGWLEREIMIQPPVVDTVVIHTIDTIIFTDEIHDTTTLTYYKTIQVPFTVVEVDTVVDSVRVTLPYERHFASLDSVADVWYSGYDAKIDSAVVYKHQQTVIEQYYITQPAKPNIIGVEAGAKNASVMYMRQLGAFYVGISAGSTYEGKATAKGIVGICF